MSGTEWIKAGGALAASVWLLVSARAPAVKGEGIKQARIWLALAGVGVGLGIWLLTTNIQWGEQLHDWDTYHYYMGAKYFPELGYRGLYDCSLAADLEGERAGDLHRRTMRDLTTFKMVAAVQRVGQAEACRRHFSEERWRAFGADDAWFHSRVDPVRWEDMHKDHGLNSTPVWLLAGRLLTSTGPASTLQVGLLTGLDILLLGVMWLLVVRTFGWRPGLAAFAFWLTNYPAKLSWTSGAFLRQPWLALSVGGICLLHLGHPLLAGAALGWASCLRLFPAMFFFGPGVNMARRLLTGGRPRISHPHRRLLLGALLAAALLLTAGTLATGRPGVWPEFWAKLTAHMATPATNTMGLRVVASFSDGTRARALHRAGSADPYRGWRDARRQTYLARRPVFYALVAGFVLLLAYAVRGREDWRAALLSVGLLPLATESANYYYAVLLVYGLLAGRSPMAAAGLNLYSAVGWAAVMFWPAYDEHFTWLSGLTVCYVLAVTAAEALEERAAKG